MALRYAVCGAALLAGLPASIASAQGPTEFYRGKTIDLYINVSVGGGYDLYARMVGRHLGKHIPGNPTVLPKNMEGSGGMRLAIYMSVLPVRSKLRRTCPATDRPNRAR